MNRKALVFGGSGFIGSHVVVELLQRGYKVLNYDRNPFPLEEKKGNYSFVQGNMANGEQVISLIQEFCPSVVYNFASECDIRRCMENPYVVIFDTTTNLHILEGMRRLASSLPKSSSQPLPHLVYASSVYVHNELSGPYGIGKRSCEDWIRYYASRYGFTFTLLRYGTVYGPGAGGGNSVRRIIEEALKTGKISYYGTGEEVREYIHVDDVARCSVQVLDQGYEKNMAVVVSGICPTKAKDLVRMLKDILGEEYEMEFRGEKVFDHYEITPYKSTVRPVRKIVLDAYFDLGAGLFQVVEDLRSEKND